MRLLNNTNSTIKCSIEVTEKAVNLCDGEGMQVPCILKFEILEKNLSNL